MTYYDEHQEERKAKRRRYYAAHRREICAKNYHRPRGLQTYTCSRCGKKDTLDGSERADSGLCLDCWCYDENRKSDAWYAKRIAEIRGGTSEAANDSDYHKAGQVLVAADAIARAIMEGDVKRTAEKFRRGERRDEYLSRPEVRERRNALARARYHAMDGERRAEMLRKQRERHAVYYREHREEILERQRARKDYHRAYYQAHKEKIRAYMREWKRKHKTKEHKNGDS